MSWSLNKQMVRGPPGKQIYNKSGTCKVSLKFFCFMLVTSFIGSCRSALWSYGPRGRWRRELCGLKACSSFIYKQNVMGTFTFLRGLVASASSNWCICNQRSWVLDDFHSDWSRFAVLLNPLASVGVNVFLCNPRKGFVSIPLYWNSIHGGHMLWKGGSLLESRGSWGQCVFFAKYIQNTLHISSLVFDAGP